MNQLFSATIQRSTSDSIHIHLEEEQTQQQEGFRFQVMPRRRNGVREPNQIPPHLEEELESTHHVMWNRNMPGSAA